MMMRSLFLLSWLSVALAGHEGARSSNLRRTQAQPSNSSLPNGPGLLASATFLGFNVTVGGFIPQGCTLHVNSLHAIIDPGAHACPAMQQLAGCLAQQMGGGLT